MFTETATYRKTEQFFWVSPEKKEMRPKKCINLNAGGMLQPGRTFNPSEYSFGFNSQEKVNEITPDHYTALYWEYDARLGGNGRWNTDPKPDLSISPYSCFNGNPIWFSDPMGDTVIVTGFKEKRILRKLSKGLNVTKEENPFYFEKGKLQIDPLKASKLSTEQQGILENINSAIENDIVFTLKKSHWYTQIPIVQKATTKSLEFVELWQLGGAATVPNVKPGTKELDWTGKSGVTIYWTGRRPGSVEAVTGGRTSYPSYIVPFHEIGGHGYYRYILKKVDQGELTIEYENKVRRLHHIIERKPDPYHTIPTKY
ncbi:MAG: hypothetical protein HYY40_11295 [Bacteroidetes bacterium]|nr:hypothetical protein [Bacteroidota bacterium]